MDRPLRLILATFLIAGCGSDPHEEMRAEANRIDEVAHALASSTDAYCDGTIASVDCESAAGHGATLTAAFDDLARFARRLDTSVRDVGRPELADTLCGEQATAIEVERIAGGACAAAVDPAVAIQRHCDVLLELAAQLHARANAVLAATGHSVTIGGSGSMPPRVQRLPTGVHDWPWASGAQPAAVPVCPGPSAP